MANIRKMNIYNFEEHFHRRIIERGKSLFHQRRFRNIQQGKQSPEEWTATIEGDTDDYEIQVVIQAEGSITGYSCTCPYDWMGPCKHIAALLFEIREISGIQQAPPVKTVHVRGRPIGKKKVANLQNVKDLSPVQQQLLKVAALLLIPASKKNLIKWFRDAGLKQGKVKTLDHKLNGDIQHLLDEGFLKAHVNGQIQCPESFANEFCDAFFEKDPDFKKITAALEKYFEQEIVADKVDHSNLLNAGMRLHRYSGDGEKFYDYYHKLLHYPGSSAIPEKILHYFTGKKFDRKRLESIAPDIRWLLISYYLQIEVIKLEPLDDYLEYSYTNIHSIRKEYREFLAGYLGMLYFFKGEKQKLEVLRNEMELISQKSFEGIEKLLAGQIPEAILAFQEAQNLQRQESRKAEVMLVETPGLFQTIACLAGKDPTCYQKIHKYARKLDKKSSIFSTGIELLEGVVDHLEANKIQAVTKLSSRPPFGQFVFYYHLCLYWVNDKLVKWQQVSTDCLMFQNNGYHWIAAELNALLQEKGKQIPDIPLPENLPMYRLIQKAEKWQIILNGLAGYTQKIQSTRSEKDRLIWLVNFEEGLVQAKHQVYKNGKWSKGRMVGLEKLRREEVPGLTVQDRQIIDALDYDWGNELYLDQNAEEWKYFVGHPLLFLAESPDTSVQLVRKEPILVVKRDKNGYQLGFEPPFDGETSCLLRETATRYLYLDITNHMIQIAEILGNDFQPIPEQATLQLQENIKAISKFVQVQSPFEEVSLPSVPPDSRPCIHFHPIGEGFHAEIFVKPFRLAPPYLNPGQGEANLITIWKVSEKQLPGNWNWKSSCTGS